jgi:hypothetical protein
MGHEVVFLFFRQVFGLSSNPNNSWGPLLDGFHHRLGNFCLGGHVMRAKKCSLNLLEGDKKNILGLFGWLYDLFFGWFYYLQHLSHSFAIVVTMFWEVSKVYN